MTDHTCTIRRWGLLWVSGKHGETRHLIFENCLPVLFTTRQKAKDFASDRYGYIRDRDDLKKAPHCWRMPRAVRVVVTMKTDR